MRELSSTAMTPNADASPTGTSIAATVARAPEASWDSIIFA